MAKHSRVYQLGPGSYIKRARNALPHDADAPPSDDARLRLDINDEWAADIAKLETWLELRSTMANLSERNREIATLADTAVQHFCEEYGIALGERPKVSFIPSAKWKTLGSMRAVSGSESEVSGCSGYFLHDLNRVLIKVTPSNLDDRYLLNLTKTIVHELLHAVEFRSVQYVPALDVIDFSRRGFEVFNSKTQKTYLRLLDEAVVDSFAIQLAEGIINEHPAMFASDLRATGFCSRTDGTFHTFAFRPGDVGYTRYVTILRRIKERICSVTSLPHADVERLFADAVFHGRLVALTRAITRAYGKGGLRTFGNMTDANAETMLKFAASKTRVAQERHARAALPADEVRRAFGGS